MNRILEPVRFLERDDKVSLGAGEGLLYAPPFPSHAGSPGFRDAFQLHEATLPPAFTWTLLDGETGRPLRLDARRREWTPSRLRITFHPVRGIAVAERKCVSGHDALVSRLTVRNLSPRPLELRWVLWAALERSGRQRITDLAAEGGRWRLRLADPRGREPGLAWALGARPAPASFSAQHCEARPEVPGSDLPAWEETPFRDALRTAGRLNDAVRGGEGADSGLLYLALAGGASIPPGGVETLDGALAVAGDLASATAGLEATLGSDDPIQDADRAWRAYFDGAPHLECDDMRLASCYWHRWYALRLQSFSRPLGAVRHPGVRQGGQELRRLRASAAAAAAAEARWHQDGRHAKGCLRNFFDHQRADGALPSELREDGPGWEPAAPADWGGALAGVLSVHEDAELLESGLDTLARHARWLDGAELEGSVEALVARVRLLSSLGGLAARLGRREEAAAWEEEARRVARQRLASRWSDASGLFLDPGPDAPGAATGFLPWLTGFASPAEDAAMLETLRDPSQFWTPYPVPSLERRAPGFDPDGVEGGARTRRPRCGRVWPAEACAVADGLCALAARLPGAEPAAREFIGRILDLLCDDGDPRRPTAFEHYHPFTGTPGRERGIDDTTDSRLADLLLRHAAGVQPGLDGVSFAPRSLGLRWLRVTGIVIRGAVHEVAIDGASAVLRRDGAIIAERALTPAPGAG